MMYYNTTKHALQVCAGAGTNRGWKNVSGGTQMATGMFESGDAGQSGNIRHIPVDFPVKVFLLMPHGEGPAVFSDNVIVKMKEWPGSGVGFGSYGVDADGDQVPWASYSNTCGYEWTDQYIKDTEGYDNPISPGCPAYNHYTGTGVRLYDGADRSTDVTLTGFESPAGRPYSWIAFGW